LGNDVICVNDYETPLSLIPEELFFKVFSLLSSTYATALSRGKRLCSKTINYGEVRESRELLLKIPLEFCTLFKKKIIASLKLHYPIPYTVYNRNITEGRKL
jgi:hypothetical protein